MPDSNGDERWVRNIWLRWIGWAKYAIAVYVTNLDSILVNVLAGSYFHIAGAGTNTIKSGSGVLERVAINKLVGSGVITIYDSISGSGAVIGIITNPAVLIDSHENMEYGVNFLNGLTFVTSAEDDLTVVYR